MTWLGTREADGPQCSPTTPIQCKTVRVNELTVQVKSRCTHGQRGVGCEGTRHVKSPLKLPGDMDPIERFVDAVHQEGGFDHVVPRAD